MEAPESKRSRRYFLGIDQGGGVVAAMADMDYVCRWTSAVATGLKPINTAPPDVKQEIDNLRRDGWRLTRDQVDSRARRIRWRIRTEMQRGATGMLRELDRCVRDLRAADDAVFDACSDALFKNV